MKFIKKTKKEGKDFAVFEGSQKIIVEYNIEALKEEKKKLEKRLKEIDNILKQIK